MENSNILKRVDHTQLKAFADFDSIKQLCEQAIKYNTASVCIPASYVKRVKENFGDKLTICTVIGFPLGYSTTETKVFETKDAISNGADEIDMVINIGDVKNEEFDKVLLEIEAIKKACGDNILKVIIETCYLSETEKIKLCEIVTKAGADFIKTSTGFGTAGATVEDVKLFKQHIGENVKVKAAGGMKNIDDINAFVELGCDRLGTSSAIEILKGSNALDY